MTSEADVRRRAVELMDAGLIGDAAPGSHDLLDPIPVADPDALDSSAPRSWIVPVAVGQALAGFVELRPDLELVRYSGFAPGGYPSVRDWIDPDAIRARAGTLAERDEVLGDPVLTYDRSPSRLVWAVPATSEEGSERRLYVVGDHAYEAERPPDAPQFG